MKLFRKRMVPVPTIAGLVVFASVLLLLFVGLAGGLYPFLAQHDPLPDAQLLIVEGWMKDAELAVTLSGVHSNAVFVASGGPVEFGSVLFKEDNYADLLSVRLQKMGIPADRIISAPAPLTQKDRTYVSALAVRAKLEEMGRFGDAANLITVGTHSRRSLQMYRLVFGSEVPLGVIAVESVGVDQRRWWASSIAFKQMLTELLSWLYVQCTHWKYA